MELTEKSEKLFRELCHEAPNWNGTPIFDGDKTDAGNLLDLKKKDLIITNESDNIIWCYFTDKGKMESWNRYHIEINEF